MKKYTLFLLCILFICGGGTAFGNDIKQYKNELTLQGSPFSPYFRHGWNVSAEYKRLFLNGRLKLSGGLGYRTYEEKSLLMPFNITGSSASNNLLRPYVFLGLVGSYNWKEDISKNDKKPYNAVFDKGFDVCFDFGLGISIGKASWPAAIGCRATAYTDFQGSMVGSASLTVDWRF